MNENVIDEILKWLSPGLIVILGIFAKYILRSTLKSFNTKFEEIKEQIATEKDEREKLEERLNIAITKEITLQNKEDDEIKIEIKELEHIIREGLKSETTFWQGVFNRIDEQLKDIYLKVNSNCQDLKEMRAECKSEIRRLDQRIDGRVDVCTERHKKI